MMEMMEVVYLDNNATTALHPNVKLAIVEALEAWGNPSSSNVFGKKAKEVVEVARGKLLKLFGGAQNQVVFTSGGTETNNWIISSVIEGFKCEGKKRVITSAFEHPSVLNPLREREAKSDIELVELPIDSETGRVDFTRLPKLLDQSTCLLTVMLANNETGVYQPLKEISDIVRASEFADRIVVHSDVAQVVGKRLVDIKDLGVDVITVVGHKFYGPRIGALVWNEERLPFGMRPLLFGGGQESGYRSGTENTPMVAGLGAAALEALGAAKQSKLISNRNGFEAKLKEIFGNSVKIHFEASDRLENTTSACFPDSVITACEIVEKASTFIASTGAACHATSITPSAVLLACGITEHEALRTIRFSFNTTEVAQRDISRIVEELHILTTDRHLNAMGNK
ncbi:hypothetical protein L596_007311 [Steinernema carpocapsae]|uniref:Selenocysteine lyase n=1 Tax=Steinernema carpocapsae TaxID=34508 RepID=A0A4U5P8W1_STECR|nr:hypothetical protein L596_007311 [Steinernema carpocapsae]